MTLLNAQSPNGPVDFDGYNTTGSTIPAGSVVRITGAAIHPDLGYPFVTIELALSDDTNTMPAAGITIGDIADGETGTVRQWGIISSIDTSAFADGDPLYVSDTVAGSLVTDPNEPVGITQYIGQIRLSDVTDGQVFVYINPMMDGHVSYTNRGQFEIFKNGTTPVLKLSGSGGSIIVSATPTGNRVIGLPDASTDLIGDDTTDTLTNKTFDTAGAGNSLLINGLAATANTGSGAVARADSPVFTTGAFVSGPLSLKSSSIRYLALQATESLTSARALSIVVNDADRTLTLPGNATVSGTNTGDQTITLTGDVTGTGTGSFAATIANNAVSMAKLADIASQTIIGRGDASTGDPSALTLETGIAVTTGEVFKASGRWLRRTIYTSGSGTHTPGTDCGSMDVECWGNGGGGGGADQAGAGQAGAGGGGGAGGMCRKRAANSGTYSYVIPSAAAGGTAGDNDGATGGDVTFTGTNFALTAKGGTGGAGGASTATANTNQGGTGAICTGGDINGAGAPGTTGAVINGASAIAFAGTGGSTPYGRGGGGRVSHGVGAAAIGSGCGGGGAVATTTSTPRAGGDGTAGIIIVDEYTA